MGMTLMCCLLNVVEVVAVELSWLVSMVLEAVEISVEVAGMTYD